MPKRLAARKLSNPSVQTTAISSEKVMTWSTAGSNQMATGHTTDPIRLYNPNDFLQTDGVEQTTQEAWSPLSYSFQPQPQTTTTAPSLMMPPSVNVAQDTCNWANGTQNGQVDPWAWNTSNSPSPVETPNSQLANKKNVFDNTSMQSNSSVIWSSPQEDTAFKTTNVTSFSNVELPRNQQQSVTSYQHVHDQQYSTTSSNVWDHSTAYATTYQQQQSPFVAPVSWQNDLNHYQWPDQQKLYQAEENVSNLVQSSVSDSLKIGVSGDSGVLAAAPSEIGVSSVSDQRDISNASPVTSSNSAQGYQESFMPNNERISEGFSSSEQSDQQIEISTTTPGTITMRPPVNHSLSHLFQRSDSWLSGSSLQTINNSLCGSQDTLDASHFVPAETVEAVRQYMQSLAINQEAHEEKYNCFSDESSDQLSSELENSIVNQEVPSGADVSGNISLPHKPLVVDEQLTENKTSSPALMQQNSDTSDLERLPVTEQNILNDDGIRQPPDGAAAIRPANVIGGRAFVPPSNAAGSGSTLPTVSSSGNHPQSENKKEESSLTRTSSQNVLQPQPSPEERENVENLQAYQGDGTASNNKPEGFNHPLNVYSNLIGPRDGSPFKPPPKSVANISSIIQQELPDNNSAAVTNISQVLDHGANLEMTPDNAERPNDFEHLSKQNLATEKEVTPNSHALTPHEYHLRHGREYNSSPSTTLWKNPEPKQGNVFLVPAASSTPVQQNILIVPQLNDQQANLDDPLGSNIFQSPDISASDNLEIMSENNLSKTLDEFAGGDVPTMNTTALITEEFSVNSLVSSTVSNVIQQEISDVFESSSQTAQTVSASDQPLQKEGNLIKAPALRNSNLTTLVQSQTGIENQFGKDSGNLISMESTPFSQLRGQRPPVPGLGPVQPPRAMSEPPNCPSPTNKPDDKGGPEKRHDRRRRDELEPHFQEQDERNSYEYHRRDVERERYHQHPDDHAEPRRRLSRGYEEPGENQQRVRDYGRERVRDRDDRIRYREDPYYSMDRDRSRPSSRGSMDYEYDRQFQGSRTRDYPYQNEQSRSGYDSDRENYHRKSSYNYKDEHYKRGDEHYKRDQQYYNRGYDYSQYEQDRLYQRYYNDPYYNYNNYNFGYYDELYRTDPRYRAQYEAQYRDYYARYNFDNMDRRSVQSGRSSVNDEYRQDRDKYTQEYAQATSNQSYEQLAAYPDYSQQENSYYQQPHYKADDVTVAASLTPAKFPIPHTKVQFTATGQLVKILPNNPIDGQPAVIEIHDVQMMFAGNKEMEELKTFPGPLQKGQTHKNDVIQFCIDKSRMAKDNLSLQDRSSCVLLWELLTLFIRQNGTVVGTDIAELLLRDHEYLSDKTVSDNSQEENVEPKPGVNTQECRTSEIKCAVVQDCSVINKLDEEKVTRKFREYLLFGRKKEALEKAMKNGLWGHALFLASKMDTRTYANVMTRFANSLKLNDPLQTLYQLMSGRQPAAVTCVAEEKWGDWRPHLAMILSNTTNHPDTDRRSIVTLGDTLAAKGCLYAAQFCYLMAEMEFGTFSSKSNKLVLLGANHSLPFNEFATTEAIQCTEVYEYAQSLANSNFLLPHFQSYRFIYATRLLEFGFVQEALHYCEVISSQIIKMPACFHPSMVKHVFDLASQLKYFDPLYMNTEGERNEIEDPQWLQHVRNVIHAYDSGVIHSENPPLNYQEGENVLDNNSLYLQNSETAPDTAYYNSDLQHNNEMMHSNDQIQSEYLQPNQQDFSQFSSQPTTDGQQSYADNLDLAQQQLSGDPEPYQQMYQTEVANQFSYYNQADNNYAPTQDMLGSSPQQQHVPTQNQQQTKDFWDITTNKASIPPTVNSSNELFNLGTSVPRRSSSDSNRSTTDKSQIKKETKPKQSGNAAGNSGWRIGGFLSKFLKSRNQAILPDDRNPTIVWDEQQKRWVNTEEDEEDASVGPAAPPTDSEILKTIPVPKKEISSSISSEDYNKFRRSTGKGVRQNYVDVVSKGMTTVSTSVPSTLFQLMEPSSVNPTQLLIPTAVPGNVNANGTEMQLVASTENAHVTSTASRSNSPANGNENEQNEVSAQPPVPMMYNPSQLPIAQGLPSQRRPGPYGRRYPQ